jgi:hypothetical protein
MELTLTAMRKNRQWIKRSAEKNTLNMNLDAFDDWTTEGGSSVAEAISTPSKKVLTYRKIDRHL